MKTSKDFFKAVASNAWMRFLGGKGEFADLQEKTAIVLAGDLPKHLCQDLVRRIDEILDSRSHPMVWRDDAGSDGRILAFENEIGDLVEHFQIQRRIRAIEAYLARPVRSWFLMANRVLPTEGNLGSGGGLHRDSPFSHQVKCIWYLTDVGTGNGPFEFVPNSHSNTLASSQRYSLGEYRFDCVHKDDILVEVIADAGSLLVCDTKCIHRGKPIERGTRYAVTLYTSPHVDELTTQLRKLGMPKAPLSTSQES